MAQVAEPTLETHAEVGSNLPQSKTFKEQHSHLDSELKVVNDIVASAQLYTVHYNHVNFMDMLIIRKIEHNSILKSNFRQAREEDVAIVEQGAQRLQAPSAATSGQELDSNDLFERAQLLGSRWRSLAEVATLRTRFGSDVVAFLELMQEAERDLDLLSEVVRARLAALGNPLLSPRLAKRLDDRSDTDDKCAELDEKLVQLEQMGDALKAAIVKQMNLRRAPNAPPQSSDVRNFRLLRDTFYYSDISLRNTY